MKIYTKTGDQGETGLFSGKRVPKNSPYVEAYGNVDELNSVMGMCMAISKSNKINLILEKIQHELFNLGADLATAFDDKNAKANKVIKRINETPIQALEKLIDEYDAKLEPLKTFILPGGSQFGASLHLARTVCRRAERAIVGLVHEQKANPCTLKYLNRLSDFLFVLARSVNQSEGKSEIPWSSKT